MNIADIIQTGILVVALVTFIVTIVQFQKSAQATAKIALEQNRCLFFAEYTRRYQDIILQMPAAVFFGNAEAIDINSLRYMRLYFDLCSEEIYLYKKGLIPHEIWGLWKEGMQQTIQQTHYKASWRLLSGEYNKDFRHFVEDEIIKINGVRSYNEQ